MPVWTPPTTRATGYFVTASVWNTEHVDNLNYIIDSAGHLAIASTGPHALGGVVASHIGLYIRGSFSPTGSSYGGGMQIGPTLSPEAGDDCHGLLVWPTLVEAGSGTHNVFSSAIIQVPTITAGAASVTNVATLYINGIASAGANNYGLFIDGLGHDSAVVALADSSDIAHGITSVLPTNVYGTLSKAVSTSGGLAIRGLSEDVIGLDLKGNGITEDTVSTSAANGAVNVNASKKSGTALTQYGTTANIFVVRNEGGGARFIVKGDGNLYADGTLTTYFAQPNGERYDDALLCLAWESTLNADPRLAEIQRTHGRYFTDDLVAAGILAERDPATGRHFMNLTAMAKLSLGAAWQTALALKSLADRVDALEQRSETP